MNSLQNAADDIENRKKLLQLVTAAAVCFMLCRLFIMPAFAKLERQQKQREQLQQELELYQEFAATHQDYETFFQQQSARLAQLQKNLPDEAVFSDLLPVWQQQARNCGVKIEEVKLLPSDTAGSRLNRQQVRIAMAGNYYNVLKFIRQLENSENFVNLNKVNITGDENKGDIKFTAVLNIYLYRTES